MWRGRDRCPLNADQMPATFTAGIAQSRASGSSWDANDTIGIYMLEAGTTTVVEGAANRKYLTAAADGNFAPADAAQAIYFPVDENRKVDFIAYYPQTATVTDTVYKVDVSSQTTPAAIDLMYSNNATGRDKLAPKVALEFTHRLSRVEVNVTAGTGFTADDLQGLSISLSGQPTQGEFNVLTGGLSLAPETATVTLNTAADGRAASAIILPQGEMSSRRLTFGMRNGFNFAWNIETTRTFEAGKKTLFNITLARTEIIMTTSILPWGTQGTVGGDADIQ